MRFVFPVLALTTAFALAADEKPVKCEIVTLSWSGNIKGLAYASADGVKSMDVYESGLTEPEEYTGPAVITFYADQAALTLPPEKRPAPLGIAKLPAGISSVLLLFTPLPDSPGKMDIRAINNSVADFPPGAYRVFNLTPAKLQIATDKTLHPAIAPQRLGIIRLSGGDPVRDMDIRIAVDGKEVYTSQWGHRDIRRTTVFISPDPRGHGQLLIRKYYQTHTPPPEP